MAHGVRMLGEDCLALGIEFWFSHECPVSARGRMPPPKRKIRDGPRATRIVAVASRAATRAVKARDRRGSFAVFVRPRAEAGCEWGSERHKTPGQLTECEA